MKDFLLDATPKTPKLHFDYNAGSFEIAGRSIPENSIDFYQPLLDWVKMYSQDPREKTVLSIKLEYFNTSSSKCLVEILRKLEKIHQQGHPVEVVWHYEEEDEDMLESGEDFKEIIKVPFTMVVMEDESSTGSGTL